MGECECVPTEGETSDLDELAFAGGDGLTMELSGIPGQKDPLPTVSGEKTHLITPAVLLLSAPPESKGQGIFQEGWRLPRGLEGPLLWTLRGDGEQFSHLARSSGVLPSA